MFGNRNRNRRRVLEASLRERSAATGDHTGTEAQPGQVGRADAAEAVTAEVVAPSPVQRVWGSGFGLIATRSLQIIIVVALAAGVIWGMSSLTTVVIPILLALIFASTFSPVMVWLQKHRVPSALATVIVLLSIMLLLGGVGWLIAWAVRDQWDDLASQAHDGFLEIISWAESLPFVSGSEQLIEWRDSLVDFLTGFVTTTQFGTGALAGVGVVTSFVTGVVLLVVVLFFFLKDGPKIWRFMLRPLHGEHLQRAERVGHKTVDTLGHYVRGTASVAAVDAIGIWIGLLILDVPLALPLSVLVFILAFIPIVGATLAGILAALVALVANGVFSAVAVVGVVVLVNQLEGNFLQPVLMGRALKLHSLVILLALTVGTVLSGILGAVLAVPIAAVAWGIIQVWDGPELPARWARAKPTDP